MKVSNEMVKLVQSQLNAYYNAGLKPDGWSGPKTLAAILRIPTVSANWSEARKFVGAIQHFATQAGFGTVIDGYWGPNTAQAYDDLVSFTKTGKVDNWRDADIPDVKNNWPVYSEANMNAYFGPVGTNQSKVDLPFTMRLAWALDTKLNRFTCHKLVVDSIREAMEDILEFYTLDGIHDLKLDYFGGCLNVRKMRGGTKWSTHSWGTAIDFIPQENRLRWKDDKASLAKPVYNEFWNAWEKQGWVSLGREKNYDWMHVQASRLR